LEDFLGYHSEWNLGSPGGWDYQRTTQIIGKTVWERLNRIRSMPVKLDFDHPMLFPVYGFVEMLIEAHRAREGTNTGLIAVVAEEETLDSVTENKNLADHLNAVEGVTGILIPPQDLELQSGRVSWKGQPVSIIFMDFNTDVLLSLHRRYNLDPLLQAVKEQRVINPRGTEPINVKSVFEVITGSDRSRFHQEIVRRTPWTRQFYPRKTEGPKGEAVENLIEWTRANWDNLVLKPERGYSGKGVRVGEVDFDADEAIELAITEGNYIVQEKILPSLWAEEIPAVEDGSIVLKRYQTDFRCLIGPDMLFGFLGRFGGIPTNVGSGGGVQPLAVLKSDMPVREAVNRINDAILAMNPGELLEIVKMRNEMALDHKFTYLLGPIEIALRPRLLTAKQLQALKIYCARLWSACLILEKMWLEGQLDYLVKIEEKELEIARMNPWKGSPAIIAGDGLFSFGAHPWH